MTNDARKLLRELNRVGATPVQSKMAALLLDVNGLDNALEFVRGLQEKGLTTIPFPMTDGAEKGLIDGVRLKNKLRVLWTEKDGFLIHYPVGVDTRVDANYIAHIIPKDLARELDARGYNMKTFRLEICPKVGNRKFVSERGVQK